ncbi:5-formyltetrahydrofolate cyclo-ligase [Pontibacterium granulatum]|uniref:5-formyltetrahydrofolate cyclo-ligase n=1 Tax=Pontibacterium granulatum TaxID=2036029 RepID=UPI00249A43A3|nr:5-formyltetrahydrofolate cyclo-ligase [Pontibacterium granulatum]MDI3325133.1 5-formyltetrahydrofolate cyclo-ligase [Pontibacterium granulatum]
MNPRQQLRQEIRRKRRALTKQQQLRAAKRLHAQICRRPEFIRARHIALYLPNDGEIDPRPLLESCWRMGKKTYLPVLHPILHNRLWFVPFDRNTKLVRNIYNIEEPPLLKSPRRPPWALDMVLLPLVAFDADGNRMGMGGGYYDRTFSFKSRRQSIQGPKLVGLAHELQRVERLPVESWDIPLAGIITDEDCYMGE